ncbi:MAG: ferric reductase-like transmembrane domain-containing protein, partial [Pseudomonadota bacterium]
LALLLLQPLLATGILPGLETAGRHLHRWTGAALLISVLAHVGGLWITSPPDVLDALVFRSPTPFSVWGVVAMWAIFATSALALLRRRLRLRWRTWQSAHLGLACVIVGGTVIHALLIEGTMETLSKLALCLLAALATLWVIAGPALRRRRRQGQ